MRKSGMAVAGALALVWCMAVVGAACAAEAAADSAVVTPVGTGPSYTVELTSSYHAVSNPYFGAAGRDRRDDWGEGLSRVRLNDGLRSGLWGSVGGVVMGTAGKDYFGIHDVSDGCLDQLEVGASNIGGTGFNLTVGRQDLVLGDGFLIGDGYLDTKAALWNIPLNFFDAVKADWKQGQAHALAFGANLSPSWGAGIVSTKGQVYGGEAGWSPSDAADLTATFLQRNDTGESNMDANAFSLRGKYAHGPATLYGEAVLEGGKQGDVTLAGKGGHVGLTLVGASKCAPTLKLEYFQFSGDDPATSKNEAYYPWMFRWNDWSQYYVGDLLSATVLTSSDMRIMKVQVGMTPREGTGLRLLGHRMDLDTGASRGLEPGVSKEFAYEYDLIVDQSVGKHWSGWVMGAYVTPLDAAKKTIGTSPCGQVFASVSYKFGGPGGGSN